MTDPLQCTFADAARNHLRDGIRLSTAAKVDFFEEMVTLAVHFGARNRTIEREMPGPESATTTAGRPGRQ